MLYFPVKSRLIPPKPRKINTPPIRGNDVQSFQQFLDVQPRRVPYLSSKSCICHSYEKHGGWRQLLPIRESLWLLFHSLSDLQNLSVADSTTCALFTEKRAVYPLAVRLQSDRGGGGTSPLLRIDHVASQFYS